MAEQGGTLLEQLRSGALVPKGMAALRFEREERHHYRDCLLFYMDGRARFERYCYGEAAGLVFGVWLEAIGDDGAIQYQGPFGIEVRQEALPQSLEVMAPDCLLLDGKQWKWKVAATLPSDPKNGYSRLKVVGWRLFRR